MSTLNLPKTEKIVFEQPTILRSDSAAETSRRSGDVGWWIAAIVALVAIVGVIFMFNTSTPRESDLQAAAEAGRSQAMMESATLQAESAVQAANQATAIAAIRTTQATQAAADSANATVERAARETHEANLRVLDAAADVPAAPQP